MKIGIITLWEQFDNYGGLLVTFSLQAYLRQQGQNAYIIRHRSLPGKKEKLIGFPRRILRFLLKGHWLSRWQEHCEIKSKYNQAQEKAKLRQFDAFRRQYVKMSEREYHSLREIQQNPPPEADVYITGSDIVWGRPLASKTYENIYYLNFGPKETKRIAYAASFGSGDSLPCGNAALFHKLVSRFDKVSVREASGVKICASAGIQAVHCIDPTFLLTADTYKGIMTERKHSGDYAYFYLVNVASAQEIYWQQLRNHIAGKGVEGIVTISSGDRPMQEIFEGAAYDYATVGEWLANMFYAKIVLTSSFHGAVFSIIFHKDFVFLPRKGSFEGRNERCYDLLEVCGLRDRVAASAGDAIRLADTAIDYENLNDGALKQLIRFSKDFLRLE